MLTSSLDETSNKQKHFAIPGRFHRVLLLLLLEQRLGLDNKSLLVHHCLSPETVLSRFHRNLCLPLQSCNNRWQLQLCLFGLPQRLFSRFRR
jgi:hypothetical protein